MDLFPRRMKIKGEFKVEIIYFLLPVVTIVSAIWYFIREMNAASYLRRPAAAPVFAASAGATEPDLAPSLEQRYVDWFTSDRASRAREKPGSSNDEDFLAGTGFMAGGKAYRPDYDVHRVVH